MEPQAILKRVDREKLQKWLSTLVIPWIVKPSYFIQMGFSEMFVRQYVKNHKNAVRLNGEIVRRVRGISEIDFLWGLAEAIGADTTEANLTRSKVKQTRLCIEACLAVLEQIEDPQQESFFSVKHKMANIPEWMSNKKYSKSIRNRN